MKKILLEISYLGTNFCGYQVQPQKRTVQQQLNIAAEKLFGFECDIVGCSRTDSGVHALQYFAAVTQKGCNYLQTSIMIDKIPSAMSFYLPDDITVRSAQWVDVDFHPRHDVSFKEYTYLISNSRQRDPFEIGRSWHYPRFISDVALSDMQAACKNLIGTYDFSTYMAANSSVSDTVRTIFSATVEKREDMIIFKICGDGFLYNMVRIIVGTLILVAEGKIRPEDIPSITESKDRSRAGVTAPPQGLYLSRVVY